VLKYIDEFEHEANTLMRSESDSLTTEERKIQRIPE
jgi:hypothetical protein